MRAATRSPPRRSSPRSSATRSWQLWTRTFPSTASRTTWATGPPSTSRRWRATGRAPCTGARSFPSAKRACLASSLGGCGAGTAGQPAGPPHRPPLCHPPSRARTHVRIMPATRTASMAIDVRMPKLSDNMEEGTIIRWMKAPGDQVTKGEPLAEVETDKADVELEAAESGVLREIKVAEGESAAVGAVIAVLASDGEAVEAGDGGKAPAAPRRAAAARGEEASGEKASEE